MKLAEQQELQRDIEHTRRAESVLSSATYCSTTRCLRQRAENASSPDHRSLDRRWEEHLRHVHGRRM
ncbi:hypothetical protein FQN60_012697, partial [Etheostoma spectabile]